MRASSRWLPLLLGLAATAAPAQDRPIAFVGARLVPIDGPEIEPGSVVVEGGRITAVGPTEAVEIPGDAERIDVSGRWLMPGLVCTHSHIGGVSGGDRSGPIQPDARVLDSIDVLSSGFRRAVAGGLTTLNLMPGSGHLLSGQTLYVKLRGGDTIDDLMLLSEDGRPLGGMKMANGTNSRGEAPFPGTRAKSAALVREQYVRAQHYREMRRRHADDPEKLPARDLELEALGEVLDRKRVVHHHTHRHDDILTVLRLAEEFGFDVVLQHGIEAWKVADRIAEAGAPVSAILVDSPGGKLEARDHLYETPGILERAGVLTALHTDDWITDSRVFLRMAGLAVRGGMSRAGALSAVTLAGATMIGLDDRIGSLTVGKDADLVVLDGDPLSVYTKVLETWVEGRRVFDRTDPTDRLHAVGGYGAGRGVDPRELEAIVEEGW